MKRVGYWMSEKKCKKLNFEEHVDMFRNAGIELLKIDLEKPLEAQGPFDLLLHKFTDILVKGQQGYIPEQRIMRNIENYIDNHPECIIMDPLDGIRKLLDRHEQYNLVLDCNTINTAYLKDEVLQESYMFIPTFVDLLSKDLDENRKKLLDANVQYPFVCKPIVAHGTKICHKMMVIFNDEGLKDISPPCVAQTFVNHNAMLYKIFKIGSKQYIGHRPSLKNLYAGDHPTIFFDTHDVCKSDSSHHLTEPDEGDLLESPYKPDLSKLNDVGEALRKKLNLDLFGVDVIIECDTQRYAVIDINVFPSYDMVDNFFSELLDHLLFVINKHQDKHSPQSHGCPGKHGTHHAMLKDTGRTLSQDSNSEHICSKRLKTVDKSKDCSCDGLNHAGCIETCLIDFNAKRKQEMLSSEERRNHINAVGKNSECRIRDPDEYS